MPAAWGTAMTETKPKRRWFRFSIRDLFWLTFVAAVFAAWYSDHRKWTFYYREAADRGTRLAKERDDMETTTNAQLRQIRMRERQLLAR